MFQGISRKVLLLSLVSLFTDIASEMLYPVLPLYFKSIGFSIAIIGILEGIADGIAGLSKGYFGQLSDQYGSRMLFVRLGYGISAFSKPFMAVFTFKWWVFIGRSADRLGKGIRTGARDAILAEESTAQNKGKVFGFHRALDTTGAFLGPLLALLFLWFYPGEYRMLLFLALVPGLVAWYLTFRIPEKPTVPAEKRTGFFAFLKQWKSSDSQYKKASTLLLIFAIFNSSDVFLLLRFKETGVSDSLLLGAYIFYNIVFAVVAFPMGKWADVLGFKKILILGWVIFAIVYAGFAFSHETPVFALLFLLYGIFAAATEGLSKAYISSFCQPHNLGEKMGGFAALQSVATMVAGGITGFVWCFYGSATALSVSAAGAVVAIVCFLSISPPQGSFARE